MQDRVARLGRALMVALAVLSTANAAAQQRQPRSDDGQRDRGQAPVQQAQPGQPQSSGLRNPDGDGRGGDPQGQLRAPGERPPHQHGEWRLGAEVELLDTGVRVRSVEPRSAAAGSSELARSTALIPQVPVNQQRAGVEDRRVSARDDAYDHRKHERAR